MIFIYLLHSKYTHGHGNNACYFFTVVVCQMLLVVEVMSRFRRAGRHVRNFSLFKYFDVFTMAEECRAIIIAANIRRDKYRITLGDSPFSLHYGTGKSQADMRLTHAFTSGNTYGEHLISQSHEGMILLVTGAIGISAFLTNAD